MTLFDSYVVVDWSAAARPATGANSIWIAVADRGAAISLVNPSTRAEAEELLRRRLDAAAGERVLLAIDVGLGYPAGSAELFGLAGEPWASTWAEITSLLADDDTNRSNRFTVAAELNRRSSGHGPFWGCPIRSAGPHLGTRRPGSWAVEEFRLTERRLRDAGLRPKSMWQLAYPGSVGSQTLTAVPMLERLRRAHPDRTVIWPFGGAEPPTTVPGSIVVAEVYPSAFPVDVPADRCLDAAQVATVAEVVAEADRAGALVEWFWPQLDDLERAVVEAEEGWVLGPPPARPVR